MIDYFLFSLLLIPLLVASLRTPPPTSSSLSSHSLTSYKPHLKVKIASSIAKSERRENERSANARELCRRCKRPLTICVCHGLPNNNETISLDTHVLILQHPREFRRKTISTTPLIPLVLNECTIKVGYSFQLENLPLVQQVLQEGGKPLLLFPGDDSLSIDSPNQAMLAMKKSIPERGTINELSPIPSSAHSPNKSLLILIDGTWSQARKMIKESSELVAVCQKVQFTSPGNSIYDGKCQIKIDE